MKSLVSWPLNMSLNGNGPLIHRIFSVVNNTVLHEPHMEGWLYKLYSDFWLLGESVPLTLNCSKVNCISILFQSCLEIILFYTSVYCSSLADFFFFLERVSANFPKRTDSKYFSIVGHTVSIAASQLCSCSTKTVLDKWNE